MAGLGAPELIIVLVIVLVVFGGAKLPKLARSLGEAQKEFKKGSDEGLTGKDDADDAEQSPKGPVS
jgi:sec-independent protein translocase protein TatA